MMSHEVAKLINEQINKEFYSAYLYLDMANFYGERDLDGLPTTSASRRWRSGTTQ